jgi:hypothetical protein
MRRERIQHEYDPALDATTWRGYNPTKFRPSSDPIKRGLALGKISAASRALHRKNRPGHEAKRVARENAEKAAEETVRLVVGALEMALTQLNEIPAPSQYEQHVNQKQVHNAVSHLKTKCGVRFDDSETSHRITLDK